MAATIPAWLTVAGERPQKIPFGSTPLNEPVVRKCEASPRLAATGRLCATGVAVSAAKVRRSEFSGRRLQSTGDSRPERHQRRVWVKL